MLLALSWPARRHRRQLALALLLGGCTFYARIWPKEAGPIRAAMERGDTDTTFDLLDSETRRYITQVCRAEQWKESVVRAHPELEKDVHYWSVTPCPRQYWKWVSLWLLPRALDDYNK